MWVDQFGIGEGTSGTDGSCGEALGGSNEAGFLAIGPPHRLRRGRGQGERVILRFRRLRRPNGVLSIALEADIWEPSPVTYAQKISYYYSARTLIKLKKNDFFSLCLTEAPHVAIVKSWAPNYKQKVS